MTISYSDVDGGISSVHVGNQSNLDWGNGMMNQDPLFVDASARDFHISYTSPCREVGDGSIIGLQKFDFEGDPRIAFANVDIGADEFYTHLYCIGDFTPGGAVEGKLTGVPGTAPVGIFFGSGVLEPPMQHKWGEFHLTAPWFLVGPIVPIPVNGVLELTTNIPPAPPAPYDIP